MKVRQLLYLQTEIHSQWPRDKTSLNYFDLIKSLNKKQRFHSRINKQFLRIRVIFQLIIPTFVLIPISLGGNEAKGPQSTSDVSE